MTLADRRGLERLARQEQKEEEQQDEVEDYDKQQDRESSGQRHEGQDH
jgi:hypothetical protein